MSNKRPREPRETHTGDDDDDGECEVGFSTFSGKSGGAVRACVLCS